MNDIDQRCLEVRSREYKARCERESTALLDELAIWVTDRKNIAFREKIKCIPSCSLEKFVCNWNYLSG
ncbi:hypothetical protein HNR39_000770 [Glaciimonas immobilis]|uniref:Uncharacterized protein n=1 Tax=Glaciimonas immobilis TaxID=728004 RepID=A0A840RQT4_9BURK|nr:hypothetical protein [Glaciimonas immobilis]